METKGQRKRAERDTRRDFLFLLLKSSCFVQKKKKKKKKKKIEELWKETKYG